MKTMVKFRIRPRELRMSHLSSERLAALTDEAPTDFEREHIAECELCERELAAFQGLRVLAAEERNRINAPLTTWNSLSVAIHAGGVMAPAAAVPHRTVRARAWLQAAAGILLIAGGAAAGRYSAGASVLPLVSPDSVVAQAPDSAAVLQAPTFASVDEAQQARTRYEVLYQQAAAFLAEHDSTNYSPGSPAGMRTRLAALDRVGETMRQALDEAPYDPVINGYYITTLGQREATLRQLNTALPAGVRINSF